jgi:hypothetical protein
MTGVHGWMAGAWALLLGGCGPGPAVVEAKVEPSAPAAAADPAVPAPGVASVPDMAAPAPAKVGPEAFAGLLKTGGLTYEAPPGYRVVEVAPSERWAHVHALKSTSMAVEIRFGAAPKVVDIRLTAVCEGATPCPSVPLKADVDAMLGIAVEGMAVANGEIKAKEFPLDAVRAEFNAHWGGAVAFDVDPAFATYKKGLAVVIHREGHPTAMFVTLFDGVSDAVEDERMRAFHSLRFTEPFGVAESEALAAPLVSTGWFCDREAVYLRFERSTFGEVTMSVAMLAMGRQQPHEWAYHEITYLPGGRFSARPFRVDNWERGDQTPKPAVLQHYTYTREGEALTLKGEGWKEPWTCALMGRGR